MYHVCCVCVLLFLLLFGFGLCCFAFAYVAAIYAMCWDRVARGMVIFFCFVLLLCVEFLPFTVCILLFCLFVMMLRFCLVWIPLVWLVFASAMCAICMARSPEAWYFLFLYYYYVFALPPRPVVYNVCCFACAWCCVFLFGMAGGVSACLFLLCVSFAWFGFSEAW